MKKANPELLRDLSNFIDGLRSIKKERAFEVACGECHVTRHIHVHKFEKIDLLDIDGTSIEIAKSLKKEQKKIGCVYHSSTENFSWDDTWNCIIFRFCIGYPKNADLIDILSKAKLCLGERGGKASRATSQESYILIQDNVGIDGIKYKREKG